MIALLAELTERFAERRFDKLFQLIRRRSGRNRLPNRRPMTLVAGDQIISSWSIDFMSDVLWDEQRIRRFNVIDDFSLEARTVEVSLNLPGKRVIPRRNGSPLGSAAQRELRLDKRAKLIAFPLAEWVKRKDIALDTVEPDAPMENGFIDRFNSGLEVTYWTCSPCAVSPKCASAPSDGSPATTNEIPHDSLDGLTAVEF